MKEKWNERKGPRRWEYDCYYYYYYFIFLTLGFGFCIVRTGVSMIKVKDRTTNPKKREPNPSKNGDVSRPVQCPVWPARGRRKEQRSSGLKIKIKKELTRKKEKEKTEKSKNINH